MSITAKYFNHAGLDGLLMMEWVWHLGAGSSAPSGRRALM